jgi:hypothetical protein
MFDDSPNLVPPILSMFSESWRRNSRPCRDEENMEHYARRLQHHLGLCDETLRAANNLIQQSEKWWCGYRERQNSGAASRRVKSLTSAWQTLMDELSRDGSSRAN